MSLSNYIQWKINFTNSHQQFKKSLYFCIAKKLQELAKTQVNL